MTFTQSLRTCFTKFATFEGRASRAEFWWFYLFVFAMLLIPFVSIIIAIGGVIPFLAATSRRLHDTNRSGWWQALPMVPLLGMGLSALLPMLLGPVASAPDPVYYALASLWVALTLLLIAWLATEGSPGPNRFGPRA